MPLVTNFAVPVNNFMSSVASDRLSGAGSVTLVDTSALPAITGSQWFRMSFFRGGDPVTILKVTNVSGGILTVEPIDGIADANINSGDMAEICDAAGTFSDIQNALNVVEARADLVTYSLYGGL